MGATPTAPVAPPAWVSHNLVQRSVAPYGGVTETPSGTARMRQPPPSTAFRGPIWGLHRRPRWHRPHASATT
eukprot:949464-Pyramimonas_sp.AAC.1